MASISEQRLREMEAEMNRFEQEIAPSPYDCEEGYGGAGGMIIGSSTFDQVQAQLRQLRHESSRGNAEGGFAPPPPPPPPGPPPGPLPPVSSAAIDLPISALAPPPPPPPEPSSDPPPLLPPPPPPPLLNRPAFVPPQLRHRPPPPRPPMPPMGYRGPQGPMGPGPYNQHMMGPGPMGPMMGPGPMGYQDNSYQQGYGGPGHMMGGDGPGMGMGGGGFMPGPNMPSPSPAVIEAKPRVIYSAPPIRNAPKKDTKAKSEKKEKAGEITAGPSLNVLPELAVTAPSLAAVSEVGVAAEMVVMGQELEEDTTIADMELDMDVAAPTKREKKERKKKFMRTAAGTVWEDPTLAEWDNDDFRMFCGDLGNEVTDEVLTRAFSRYPTFVKAKVVRDRRSNKTKGYGFASFRDPVDFTRAMREMNGKYVGNRPIKLRKSTWKDRSIDVVRKKDKEKKRLGLR